MPSLIPHVFSWGSRLNLPHELPNWSFWNTGHSSCSHESEIKKVCFWDHEKKGDENAFLCQRWKFSDFQGSQVTSFVLLLSTCDKTELWILPSKTPISLWVPLWKYFPQSIDIEPKGISQTPPRLKSQKKTSSLEVTSHLPSVPVTLYMSRAIQRSPESKTSSTNWQSRSSKYESCHAQFCLYIMCSLFYRENSY